MQNTEPRTYFSAEILTLEEASRITKVPQEKILCDLGMNRVISRFRKDGQWLFQVSDLSSYFYTWFYDLNEQIIEDDSRTVEDILQDYQNGQVDFSTDIFQDYCNLEFAQLNGVVFHAVRLIHANFTAAGLRQADFTSAILHSTIFDEADLTNASFEDADLRGASFKGANLRNVDFTKANLENVTFKDAKFMDTLLFDEIRLRS